MLTIFIDFDIYLFTIPGPLKLHPDLHRRYFERVVDINPEKLGAYRPGQNQPYEEDFKPGFKEKLRFF